MSFKSVINLALWAYPRDVRDSRGEEMRDTALEAANGSRLKLLRESVALATAGVGARARAVASLALGLREGKALDIPEVAYSVRRSYAEEWRSLLPASGLLVATLALSGASSMGTSTGASIVSALVRLSALACFAAFVISRSVRKGADGGGHLRVALSATRSAAGEVALVMYVAAAALFLAANLPKLAVAVAFGVATGASLDFRGSSGSAAVGIALGVVPFAALLTVWSVALPIAVIERPGSTHSLARSRQLVRADRLRTLAVLVVVVAFLAAAKLLGGLLTGAMGGIGPAFVWCLAAPVPMLAASALYVGLSAASSPSDHQPA